jgi:uncharacterized membrane protein
MDDLTTSTTRWTGTDRRAGERRLRPEDYAGTERRLGERRTAIAIARPRDPTLALSDTDTLGARDAWLGADEDDRSNEHDAIPSLAAVAGHPIHPMIVPLPIGALALTMLADAAYTATQDRFFARAGAALTAVGIASGITAAAVGAVDFLGRERIRDHRAAWLHAGGNLGAVGLSAASLALRLRDTGKVPAPAVASSLIVGVLLMVTGWLGGELSYRHRVGVTRDHGADG